MFRKLSLLVGLTETEIKVLSFITAALLFGTIYSIFFKQGKESELKNYDYSKEDSLFFSAEYQEQLPEEEKTENISVDYKHEVLDFNTSNFSGNNTKVLPAENSINLNSAKLEELILLPGIGTKTAERIIEQRNKRGKFYSLNELLNIKGIGEAKFQNIKKYLYIE